MGSLRIYTHWKYYKDGSAAKFEFMFNQNNYHKFSMSPDLSLEAAALRYCITYVKGPRLNLPRLVVEGRVVVKKEKKWTRRGWSRRSRKCPS